MTELESANDNVPSNETRTSSGLVVRDAGDSMSMAEFGTWLESNLGGSLQEAMQQAAFMLCCDVIAQDVGKATLRLRKRLDNGTSEVVAPRKHAIAAMLALEPNQRHTWSEYTEMLVYWLCFTSNGYAVVQRNRFGEPVALIPVQTGRVQELVEGRDIFYEVMASTMQEQALLGAGVLRVPERDMIHVRRRMLDGMDGYSTLTAGKKTLQTGKAIDAFRESLFGEEGQIRGVFTRPGVTDDTMPDPAFQRLRQQFKILMSRFRQMTEPVVLEGGLEFKPISSNPREMEFTAQFSAQITATCRLLRVPPHKVFNLDSVKYENLETIEKDYVTSTLIPVCKAIEGRKAKALLTREERLVYLLEYDREEMMLKDTKAETERAIKSLERGAITFDEYRAIIGQNPLPGGQGKHRLVPTNMQIIDEKEQVVVTGSSQAAPADPSTSEDKPAEDSKKGLRVVK